MYNVNEPCVCVDVPARCQGFHCAAEDKAGAASPPQRHPRHAGRHARLRPAATLPEAEGTDHQECNQDTVWFVQQEALGTSYVCVMVAMLQVRLDSCRITLVRIIILKWAYILLEGSMLLI